MQHSAVDDFMLEQLEIGDGAVAEKLTLKYTRHLPFLKEKHGFPLVQDS